MDERRPFFHDRDILFMVETLLPERSDKEHLVEIIRDDEGFVEAMLGDKRLFDRVMGQESVLLRITPKLFFNVLLSQARKDLEVATYTLETSSRRNLPVFDSHKVVELLNDPKVPRYLAEMLASFTRIQSYTWRVRVQNRVWYKRRFSDLDIESLIGLSGSLDEDQRFPLYKRMADLCLFMTGVYPEKARAESLGTTRGLRRRGREWNPEEYEREGRRFYKLAAQHKTAEVMGQVDVLHTLSKDFTLAEKPLRFVADHYLVTRKYTVFDV